MGHLILTGLSGAGKSTVGRLAAAALGWDFVDLDEEIVRRAGRSVAAIFADRGEASFRRLEAEALSEVLGREAPVVVATGGGALVDPQSRALALAAGTVVWLRVSPEEAASRCEREGGRPLLADGDVRARLATLLSAREAGYAESHAVVETDGASTAEVARRILGVIGASP